MGSAPSKAPPAKRRVVIVSPCDSPIPYEKADRQDNDGQEGDNNENEEAADLPPPPMMLGMIGREKTGFLEQEAYDFSLTAQAIRLGYPPPIPPASKKTDVFKVEDYAHVDKNVSKISRKLLYKSFEELAKNLIAECKNDMEKVRALFVFTTSIDIKTLESSLEKLPEQGTPMDYLLQIHWQLGNHAHFFALLSRAAGLPSLIITGVNKSAAYEIGSPINHDAMGAQWNVVLVDGDWRLMDIYWASTCVVGKQSSDWSMVDADDETKADKKQKEESAEETLHQVNEFFFLPDPDSLICTHLPDEEDWQLLDDPISDEDFENMVYIRERYHQIGMGFLPKSQKKCRLTTNNGQIGITFAIPDTYRNNLKFRYLLFRSRQDPDEQIQVPFERYVFYKRSDEVISYDIQFPVKGNFKLDIFGQIQKAHESLDLVCSYLIDCSSPLKNIKPLPDLPDIGWGPGTEAKEAGLKPLTHNEAVIETKDGNIELKFSLSHTKRLLHDLRNNELEEYLLKRSALISEQNGEMVVNLRLREKGDYALNLFTEGQGENAPFDNVCNYLIKALKNNKNVKPFPKMPTGKLGKGQLAKELGVKPLSNEQSIKVTDGRIDVAFEAAEGVELFCELHNHDIDRSELAECIEKTEIGKAANFGLKLPAPGEYALNVFAKSPKFPNRVCHVHSYKIDTQKGATDKKPVASKKTIPIVPLYTAEEYAEVRIPAGVNPLVADFRQRNARESLTDDQLNFKKGSRNDTFRVHMPEHDDYLLDVYEQQEGDVLVHRCTVHIIRHEAFEGEQITPLDSGPNEEEEEEEQIDPEEIERRLKQKELEAMHTAKKEQLKAAIKSQDLGILIQAIREFESRGVPEENGELTAAIQLKEYLKLSQALNMAMSKRDLVNLERTLAAAEKSSMKKKLNLQMQMATKILEQLKKIEKLKHEVMSLDQKTIAEIKSYASPPECVHQVMAATFLLLGSPERTLLDWKQVQARIGRTGKESLKRRVQEFDVETLKIEVAQKARIALVQYFMDEVMSVSSGAATFYVWAMGMVEECERRFTQEGGDLTTIKVSKPKFQPFKKPVDNF